MDNIEKISTILQKCYNFKNWQDVNLLECGAGLYGQETADLRERNTCYYLEPLFEYYKFLIDHSVRNVFNIALSDKCGSTDLIVSSHVENSSISYSDEHYAELLNYGATFSKAQIQTINYQTFLAMIGNTIDVFVLDVEGHEISILKSFLQLEEAKKPKIIVIECGYDWNERYELLKVLGYELDFYYYNNAYLTLDCSEINKNRINIDEIRRSWQKWHWHGKLIYDTNIQGFSS